MIKKAILNIKATQITNCTSEIYLIQQKPLLTQFSSLKSRVWAWFIILALHGYHGEIAFK